LDYLLYSQQRQPQDLKVLQLPLAALQGEIVIDKTTAIVFSTHLCLGSTARKQAEM
jgi:hypothetical protein